METAKFFCSLQSSKKTSGVSFTGRPVMDSEAGGEAEAGDAAGEAGGEAEAGDAAKAEEIGGERVLRALEGTASTVGVPTVKNVFVQLATEDIY